LFGVDVESVAASFSAGVDPFATVVVSFGADLVSGVVDSAFSDEDLPVFKLFPFSWAAFSVDFCDENRFLILLISPVLGFGGASDEADAVGEDGVVSDFDFVLVSLGVAPLLS